MAALVFAVYFLMGVAGVAWLASRLQPQCPTCMARVPRRAIKCRHCGSEIVQPLGWDDKPQGERLMLVALITLAVCFGLLSVPIVLSLL